jgi:hypothetical protein
VSLYNGVDRSKNLSDLDSVVTALTNLGITSTAAELNKLDGYAGSTADLNASSGQIASITVVAANAAANTIDVVITALDPDGVAIANPVILDVWISDASTGLGGSVHTHSTAPSFTVGEIVVAEIANDHWRALTTAAGTCTLRLVDTANEDVTVNAGSGSVFGQDTTVSGDWSS